MILINSSERNTLKMFQPFLPISVPVGIGSLIAVARQKGIPVNFIDEQVEDDKSIMKKINDYAAGSSKPLIFGFSVLTATFSSALKLAETIKKMHPDSVIIFGGIHPTASPEEVLSFDYIDLVLRGEAENTLFELYNCLKEGRDYSNIDGLSYRKEKDGNIIHNKLPEIVTDLDSLPQFPYDIFAKNKRYSMGFVVSSRGCPYNCIFCSNRVTTNKRHRYKSAQKVVADLELLHKKYGQRTVMFLDDNFLVNRNRIFELTGLIRKKGLHKKMSFSFQGRGDNASEEVLKELYSSGFKSVFFGIETSSNKLMKVIKKGETIEQIVDAIKMAKRTGFHVSGTFIYGLPTETHEDRMKCIRLSKNLGMDQVRFNNATPYPGTELFDMAKKDKRLHVQGLYRNFNSVSSFIENPFDKIPFSYVPKGSSEKEIRNDLLFSYLAFYFDYRILKKIFARPDLGAAWFNAGDRIIEFFKKIPALFILFFILMIKFSELFINIILQRNTQISRKDLFKALTGSF